VTSPASFTNLATGDPIVLDEYELVVAGYTGRDATAVQRHIDELALIGVPPPERIPTFFPLDPGLLTTSPTVTVTGGDTSGEAEPVLVRAAGQLYMTVGSDHTDRLIESTSIALSKAACPKPVCDQLAPLPPTPEWDKASLRCRVDGEQYQSGYLAELRNFAQLLEEYEQGRDGECDLIMFGGTVPLLTPAFVCGTDWTVELELADGTRFAHSYRVQTK